MKRITFFTFGAMGDMLMLLSLVDALRAKYPESVFVVVASRNQKLLRDMARGTVLRVVYLKNPLTWGPVLGIFSSDVVILPPTFGSAPMLFKRLGRLLAWRGVFAGFKDRGKEAGFDVTLNYDPGHPYYDNLIQIMAAAGFPLFVDRPTYAGLMDLDAANRLGLRAAHYIVIHPFASTNKRSLPPRRWHALIDWLRAQYPAVELVVTCDITQIQWAETLTRGKARIVPGASLPMLAGLLKSAALYVGVDTGVTHLAALLQTPSVVLGNLSNPSWLPRYNKRGTILYNEARCACRGDKTGDCEVIENGQAYFRCLYDIADEQIRGAVMSRATF